MWQERTERFSGVRGVHQHGSTNDGIERLARW